MYISKINGYNKVNYTADCKQAAPRSQQQNKVNFEKELSLAQKADSVNANPITSLGYKLYRTFRFISGHDAQQSPQRLDTAA